MGENKIKRDWVKNFAIIFLAVLLVLTFFSNTIMNMTLPEVSTEYIQYGMIKTQVRGSGTIIASDHYSVTIPTTREIVKVAVSKGSQVKKGDVLFYLAQGDSDELEAARNHYDDLNYEYAKMLLEVSGGDDFADKKLAIEQQKEDLNDTRAKLAALSSNRMAVDQAKLDVRAAEKAVEKKQSEISELEAEKAAIGYTPTEDEVLTGKDIGVSYEQYTNATNQLDEAEKKIDTAKANLTALQEAEKTAKKAYEKIKREYEDIQAKIETPLATLEKEIEASDRNIEVLDNELKYLKQDFYKNTENSQLEKAYDHYKEEQEKYRKAKRKLDALRANGTATADEIARAEQEYQQAMERVDNAYDDYEAILTDEKTTTDAIEKSLAAKETELKYALKDNTDLKSKLEEAKRMDQQLTVKKTEVEKAESVYDAAGDKVSSAQTTYDNAVADKEALAKSLEKVRNGYKYVKVKDYETRIDALKNELEELESQLENAKETLTDLEAQGSESEESLKERMKTLERQIVSSTQELEQSIADAGDKSKAQSLELEKKKKELDKAAKEIAKLEEKYTSTEVLAPVSGVIEAMNVTTGQKTQPDTSLCEISLAEQGYKMTMTVTQEQAAKLRMGSTAEITSYIPYGSTITATLAAIKNDTANPGSRQKILEFNIEGDVTPGETLSIAVGDKNASYDSTVPNTAIREDSDGKYILIVESQATPISTRYKAKRVGVTVLASDDTRSAISGDFQSYAYVIATSSKPINNGEQVKLVES